VRGLYKYQSWRVWLLPIGNSVFDRRRFRVCNGKVNTIDDVGMVIGGKIVVPYFVFEFFFKDVVVAHFISAN
jgi:hypothetical protein